MRSLLLLLVLSTSALAQYPLGANALRWDGATSSAGPFCWGFQCRPEVAAILPGESGVLTIRGDFQAAYALGLSVAPPQCTPIRGYLNSLVLGLPLTIVTTGTLNGISPILACPPGTETLSLSLPVSVPSGSTFTLQAVVSLPPVPGAAVLGSFTQAITFRVR